MKRLDSDFKSGGLKCSGSLYLPDGVSNPPVVIMAHGFGYTKECGLDPYAEYFAGKGIAAYVFDYRNLGKSEGKPRNLVNPWRQLHDWKAAIAHVRGLSGVDTERIALWGTSFAGGHVLVTAAKVGGIKAVVSQVAFVDGIATCMMFPLSYLISGFINGMKDFGCFLLGKEPHLVPTVGKPGKFAVMNTPESFSGYMSIIPPEVEFKNQTPARISLMIGIYRPTRYAKKITCPVLMVYATKDSLCSWQAIAKTAAKIPNAEVMGLNVGHFDVYTGDVFRQVVERETDFLLHKFNMK
jgi:dienelactone hydrolase